MLILLQQNLRQLIIQIPSSMAMKCFLLKMNLSTLTLASDYLCFPSASQRASVQQKYSSSFLLRKSIQQAQSIWISLVMDSGTCNILLTYPLWQPEDFPSWVPRLSCYEEHRLFQPNSTKTSKTMVSHMSWAISIHETGRLFFSFMQHYISPAMSQIAHSG